METSKIHHPLVAGFTLNGTSRNDMLAKTGDGKIAV